MYWQTRKLPKERYTPRKALITGSSRRVGYAIAERLVAEGWEVIIHGTNQKVVLDARAALGKSCVGCIVGDLNEQDTIDACGEAVEYFWDDRLDLLVNNASTFQSDHGDMTTWIYKFNAAMESASWAYQLTRLMRNRLEPSGGLVVNITDRANDEAWEGFVAHGMAKHAIEGMGKHLNWLYKRAGRNTAVVALRLGMVLAPDGMTPDDEQKLFDRFGEPIGTDTVARAVAKLHAQPRLGDVMEITDSSGNIRGLL